MTTPSRRLSDCLPNKPIQTTPRQRTPGSTCSQVDAEGFPGSCFRLWQRPLMGPDSSEHQWWTFWIPFLDLRDLQIAHYLEGIISIPGFVFESLMSKWLHRLDQPQDHATTHHRSSGLWLCAGSRKNRALCQGGNSSEDGKEMCKPSADPICRNPDLVGNLRIPPGVTGLGKGVWTKTGDMMDPSAIKIWPGILTRNLNGIRGPAIKWEQPKCEKNSQISLGKCN